MADAAAGPAASGHPQGVDPATVRHFVHQLRSHLTAIGPAAEFIVQPDLEGDVREEMLGIVLQAAERIEGLLADLSIVTTPDRAQRGPAALIDLADLAHSAVLGHMAHAQAVGAWLAVDASPGGASVLGHAQALQQAVSDSLLLVLRLARAGDRVLIRIGPADAPAGGDTELRVELEPGEPRRGDADTPLDFDGVSMDAARIIAEQHGGTLGALTERTGLVMRLPAAPQPVRPAAAAGASLTA